MPKTLAEELWPAKGFDDIEALEDFTEEVMGFIRSGYGIRDIESLIDLVYRYDSSSLVWLVKSIRSAMSGGAAADDIKKLVYRSLHQNDKSQK